MAKIYTQAPLPFMGQKRRWNNDFKTALKNEFADCTIFVDLFGGSGLLSHFTKTVRPDAQVVYNDFDGYVHRIEAIPTTNAILAEIREIVKDVPRTKRITGQPRTQVLEVLERYDKQGYVDYITLSASILFSSNYAVNLEEMKGNTLYNTVRTSDFNADQYLDGLIVVHEDYRDLFARYKDVSGVCFLIDPPYLSTQATTYSGYWKLRDYLDVLHTLKGTNYFYFTSEKSSIIELCDWLDQEERFVNPFRHAKQVTIKSRLNYNSIYNDIMLYHHPNKQNEAS